jgi:non-heme chloroperoxidase
MRYWHGDTNATALALALCNLDNPNSSSDEEFTWNGDPKMILKTFSSSSKMPRALFSIGMASLVAALLSQRFLQPNGHIGPNAVDFMRGVLFGVSISIMLSSFMVIARQRRASRTLGLLLCCGFLAHPASAAPPLANVETYSGCFITSDGVRLHYLEAGKGTAIVFVPGWTMPAWIWERQVAHLAQHYHVVALDPRAQGESDKVAFGNSAPRRSRDIQELITRLKLAPAVLVGWSLAVPEVLSFAEQFGGRDVLGYMLVDGFVWEKQNPQFVTAMLGMYQQVQNDRARFTDTFVRSIYHKPQSEEYIKRVENASLQMPADSAVAADVSVLGRADWTPAVRKLDRPVLVMCEAALKALTADPITSLIPSAQVEIFPNAGRALFVDDADHFNSVLQGFVEKLPAQDTKGHSVC